MHAGEASLTPLEKLGYILLMIRDYDAITSRVSEASEAERPSREIVLAALDKLFADAEAEASEIA